MKKRAEGLCGCGSPRQLGRALCHGCTATRTRYWERTKNERKAAGLCIGCGQRPARTDKQTCAECSERRVQHSHRVLGIDAAEYAKRVKAQNGCCEICRKAVKPLCVDHNHATGRVRDLLCHRCNRVLGLVGESTSVLRALLAYIAKWK